MIWLFNLVVVILCVIMAALAYEVNEKYPMIYFITLGAINAAIACLGFMKWVSFR